MKKQAQDVKRTFLNKLTESRLSSKATERLCGGNTDEPYLPDMDNEEEGAVTTSAVCARGTYGVSEPKRNVLWRNNYEKAASFMVAAPVL